MKKRKVTQREFYTTAARAAIADIDSATFRNKAERAMHAKSTAKARELLKLVADLTP